MGVHCRHGLPARSLGRSRGWRFIQEQIATLERERDPGLEFLESTMARKHPPYARKVPPQMIELVRAGRRPEELAKEFEPSAQAIRNWIMQADRRGRARMA